MTHPINWKNVSSRAKVLKYDTLKNFPIRLHIGMSSSP